jgi:hypothetical protein
MPHHGQVLYCYILMRSVNRPKFLIIFFYYTTTANFFVLSLCYLMIYTYDNTVNANNVNVYCLGLYLDFTFMAVNTIAIIKVALPGLSLDCICTTTRTQAVPSKEGCYSGTRGSTLGVLFIISRSKFVPSKYNTPLYFVPKYTKNLCVISNTIDS